MTPTPVVAQDAHPLRAERLPSDDAITLSIPAPEPRPESVVAYPIRSLVSDDHSDLEFLHEELGFDVLALESDLDQCADAP